MRSKSSQMVFALLQSIVLQVQHFQPKDSQFYEEKEYQNQRQKKDPVHVYLVCVLSPYRKNQIKHNNKKYPVIQQNKTLPGSQRR